MTSIDRYVKARNYIGWPRMTFSNRCGHPMDDAEIHVPHRQNGMCMLETIGCSPHPMLVDSCVQVKGDVIKPCLTSS